LSAAVSFAEWVKRIDLRKIVSCSADEYGVAEPLQVLLVCEPREELGRRRNQCRGKRERGVALADVHRSELSCPVVDVLEDVSMDRLKVREVVSATEWIFLQLDETGAGDTVFDHHEFAGVGDTAKVS
jgi:hypothetical protein